jgi:SAM-dependent methyltransferase
VKSGLLTWIADSREGGSIAARLRKRRHRLFRSLVDSLPRPVRILDVGGLPSYWNTNNAPEDDVHVVLLNMVSEATSATGTTCVAGDARDMRQFADREFDVVFSNAVLEHVGDLDDQRRAAREIRRVGKRYFVQTPNRHFPIESHFLFPFVQFLPRELHVWLVAHFDLGWHKRARDRAEAVRLVSSIRLLVRAELEELFPDGTIACERLGGLTKSFMVYRW